MSYRTNNVPTIHKINKEKLDFDFYHVKEKKVFYTIKMENNHGNFFLNTVQSISSWCTVDKLFPLPTAEEKEMNSG